MGKFTRAEIGQAFRNYTDVVEGCTSSGDSRLFADLFSEDVIYTEHHYGVFHGREAVEDWIVGVMAPFPHMRFPNDWVAFDEDNDALVMMIRNLLDHPTDPNGEPFWFPNWTGWSTPATACFPAKKTSTTRTVTLPVSLRLAARRRQARHPEILQPGA